MGTAYEANEEQRAFLEDVTQGRGNTILSARAGTGKTRTILESLTLLPPSKRRGAVLIAFSSDIAAVLKKKAPAGVEVKTMHSLGLRACVRAWGSVEVDKYRGSAIAAAVGGAEQDSSKREWCQCLQKVVSMCKGTMSETDEAIDGVIDRMGLEHPGDPTEVWECPLCQRMEPYLEGYDRAGVECGSGACKGFLRYGEDRPRDRFIAQVKECLDRATYDLVPSDVEEGATDRVFPRTIDFDDMCYLPVRMRLKMQKYDLVFCDECQDLNKVQHYLVVGSLARGGRFFGVGDPYQAIYRWRGAQADSLRQLQQELEAKELPMTMTYRCGTAIVEEAHKIVPDFKAAPGQHAGEVVEGVSTQRMMREAGPGDFVLSRTNAPLLGICLQFLREGRRANIKGRDVGAKLQSLVKRSEAKTVDELREWVDAWAERESNRLLSKGDDDAVVRDTKACLSVLMDGCKDVYAVSANISRLFDDEDDAGRITLSTTHRVKGMERNRVWLLRDTYRAHTDEERCLLYVGITRAIETLFMVRGLPGEG